MEYGVIAVLRCLGERLVDVGWIMVTSVVWWLPEWSYGISVRTNLGTWLLYLLWQLSYLTSVLWALYRLCVLWVVLIAVICWSGEEMMMWVKERACLSKAANAGDVSGDKGLTTEYEESRWDILPVRDKLNSLFKKICLLTVQYDLPTP